MAVEFKYLDNLPLEALEAPSVRAQTRSTFQGGEAYVFLDSFMQEIDPTNFYYEGLVAIKGLMVAKGRIEQAKTSDFYDEYSIDIACCHAWGSDFIQTSEPMPAQLAKLAAPLFELTHGSESKTGHIEVVNAGLSECGEAWPFRNESRFVFIEQRD